MGELDRELLSIEQSKALLNDGDTIHVFSNDRGNMLIGADWSRDAVIKLIEEAKQLEVGGPVSIQMGHGLVVVDKNESRWFVESRAGK